MNDGETPTPTGNRYSMDGSVDLPVDFDLPIDSQSLWPQGKRLQLQWLGSSEQPGQSPLATPRHIVYLHPDRLVIAVEAEPEKNVPWGPDSCGNPYRFYSGGTKDERVHAATRISKVELNRSWNPRFAIWVKDDDWRPRLAFIAYGIGTPTTFAELARRSIELGIGKPRPSGMFRVRGAEWYSQQLLYKDIETKFRKVAPQAEVVLKGDHMSIEDFRRVVD